MYISRSPTWLSWNNALRTDLSICLWYLLTKKILTDNEGSGFDLGEEAWYIASTSKEGSRSENYPMTHRRGSDEKYQNWVQIWNSIWDEYNLKPLTSNNKRASLVPAAAVIPALSVNLDVAAVKKLIANFTGMKFLHTWSFKREGCRWLKARKYFRVPRLV